MLSDDHSEETRPLLSHHSNEDLPIEEDSIDAPHKISAKLIFEEAGRTSHLAWPILIAYILSYILNTSSVFSLGHIGTKELAASALTIMFCNVTGFSVGLGMASALDTLCSQAFTGSTDKHALGKHLQRGIVIMLILFFPITAIWLATEPLLLLVGQDAEISRLSGIYVRWMLPGLFPYLVNDCMKRYLQAQGIMKAGMYVTLVAIPINVLLQYVLVWSPINIGPIGAIVATSITNIFICVLMILYIRYVEGRGPWGGWDLKEALDRKQLWTMAKIGGAGTVMMCAEWWAFEISAIAAGLLGDKILAAQTIILNTTALAYFVPLSFSLATSTRIGNSLGANLPNTARNAAVTAYILGFLLACLNSTILIAIRTKWGWLFSNDDEVVNIVCDILPILALFQIADGMNGIGSGILRGCGRQHLGAILNVTGYYVFGLPLAIVLTFKFQIGLPGMWYSLVAVLFAICIVLTVIIIRTDWNIEAKKAHDLVGNDDNRTEFDDIEE